MKRTREPRVAKRENGIRISVKNEDLRISVDELVVDVSAFLHFLTEHFEGKPSGEKASYWMLIPKSIAVEWRAGVDEFFLEKEINSRQIIIVAKPVPDKDREKRAAHLLNLFQNVIPSDQFSQVITILSHLKDEDRFSIVDRYRAHLNKEKKKEN